MLRIAKLAARTAAVASSNTTVTPLLATAFVQQQRYLNQQQPTVKMNEDEPIDIPNPFEKERMQCVLCKHNIVLNYKNVKLLSQFQSPYTGRIYGRHITGLCKQKQEEVEKAIIRAQNCALMPTYNKDTDFLKDPRLFDPEKPLRPHKY